MGWGTQTPTVNGPTTHGNGYTDAADAASPRPNKQRNRPLRIEKDGYHVRQSDVETYLACPEQLRLKMVVDDGSSHETDAAVVGTVLHKVIENEIGGLVYGTLGECKKFGAETFLQMLETFAADPLCSYSAASFGTHTRALELLGNLCEAWYNSDERATLLCYPPEQLSTEWNFDRLFITRPEEKPDIYLAGTSDLVFDNMVWDWKSTSSMRSYTPWEKQRWAVQPTVYTWAASDAGLVVPNSEGLFRFDYKVFVRGKPTAPQTVTVYRSENSFAWLAQIVLNMVNMAEKMGTDDPWPLNDHSALCGPKWCPFWSSCKGAIIDGETWV